MFGRARLAVPEHSTQEKWCKLASASHATFTRASPPFLRGLHVFGARVTLPSRLHFSKPPAPREISDSRIPSFYNVFTTPPHHRCLTESFNDYRISPCLFVNFIIQPVGGTQDKKNKAATFTSTEWN